VWPIPALISPFVGVFYPLATLPAWMRTVAYLLPPSYVFEGLRTIVGGGRVAATTLVWGAGLAVIDVVLACLVFMRVHAYAVRRGLLARYSAETVS
jgi:ABC-2 type transport system permease protein